MFRALLRTQFASLWAALTRSSTGSKKTSTGRAVLVAILFIYIIRTKLKIGSAVPVHNEPGMFHVRHFCKSKSH